MKKIIGTFLLVACFCSSYAQFNIELLSNLKYDVRLSNIWGWTAPDSTEYALVGTQRGVSIVSLKDPRNPREVAAVPGSTSSWREIKSWGNHAYIVTDQSGTADGLLIIDLSKLPDSVTYVNWKPTIEGLGTLGRAHTLFIDEKGICYIYGSQLNGGGAIIADVATNPKAPIYLGKGNSVYVHDGYVRNDTLYAAEIYDGRVAIYDAKDKMNVKLLATQNTPSRFTHNTWLSDNGKYLFTTDEVQNAPIAAYDISNLDDIQEVTEFRRQETLNRGVVPHNVHVKDRFLVTAYYTDGVNIIDATQPDNLIEVGNYDTYPGGDGGFNGAWGAYPYFPSGTIVVSDISNGLFVLKPTYIKAAFLNGKVTDAVTGQPISDVTIQVQSAQLNDRKTDLAGDYKTGQAIAGTFSVLFSKAGYESKTLQAGLQNDSVTILNTALMPLITYNVTGRAIQAGNNAGVANAKILVVNDTFTYETTADVAGNFNLNAVIAGSYDLYVGAWGYLQKVERNIIIDNNKTVTVALNRGYQDDFVLDLGWTQQNEGANTGDWERGIPIGTNFNGLLANPGEDIASDEGRACYMTGNGGGSAGDDDVDGGTVRLLSPSMDLTTYQNPIISYYTWFFNDGGNNNPDDSLVVRLSNGLDTITLETLKNSQSTWHPKSSFRVKDFITLTNNMIIWFETGDAAPNLHVVEAAVDAFLVAEGVPTPVAEIESNLLSITAFPNPFSQQIKLQYQLPEATDKTALLVYNVMGQLIENITIENQNGIIELGNLYNNGVYFIKLQTDNKLSNSLKVIKSN